MSRRSLAVGAHTQSQSHPGTYMRGPTRWSPARPRLVCTFTPPSPHSLPPLRGRLRVLSVPLCAPTSCRVGVFPSLPFTSPRTVSPSSPGVRRRGLCTGDAHVKFAIRIRTCIDLVAHSDASASLGKSSRRFPVGRVPFSARMRACLRLLAALTLARFCARCSAASSCSSARLVLRALSAPASLPVRMGRSARASPALALRIWWGGTTWIAGDTGRWTRCAGRPPPGLSSRHGWSGRTTHQSRPVSSRKAQRVRPA